MNHKSILLLLASLGAATLTACSGSNSTGGQPAATSEPPAAAPALAPSNMPASPAATLTNNSQSAARGSAGVKAYIDPTTGQLREPTEAELKAAAASSTAGAAAQGASTTEVAAPIVGKAIGNGVVEYDLGKRGMVDEVACVQKDGTVTTQCPPAAGKKK